MVDTKHLATRKLLLISSMMLAGIAVSSCGSFSEDSSSVATDITSSVTEITGDGAPDLQIGAATALVPDSVTEAEELAETVELTEIVDLTETVDLTEPDNLTETVVLQEIGEHDCPVLEGVAEDVEDLARIASIAGIYDMSESDDVSYTQIHSSGKVTVYDYQQDNAGQGDNCYLILDGHTAISPLSNDRYYQLSYLDLDNSCQTESALVTMTSNQDELAISYPDVEDEDEDGDFYDLFTKVYPVLSNLSVEAFNQCE